MKILIVSSVYPPDIGGPSLQVRQLAEQLISAGEDVRVLVPRDQGEVDRASFVDVLRLPRGSGLVKLWRQVVLFLGIWRTVGGFRPEVVHVQVFGGPTCIITGSVCRLRNIPSLVKLTGEKAFERKAERAGQPIESETARGTRLDRWTLALFSIIWVTTPAFAARLRNGYKVPESKIRVISNFIDLARYLELTPKRQDGPLRILTICRLQPWKGLETAIQAMGILPGSFHWTIVGAGDSAYEGRLRSLVVKTGLSECVTFAGKCHPAEAPRYYAEADVFLLLSDYEPFGIVFVEAMAAGLPIVATRTGGIPFVVGEGDCALLVEPGNAAAAAAALQQLRGNPEVVRSLGMAGRCRSKALFTLEAGVAALRELYSGMRKADSDEIQRTSKAARIRKSLGESS